MSRFILFLFIGFLSCKTTQINEPQSTNIKSNTPHVSSYIFKLTQDTSSADFTSLAELSQVISRPGHVKEIIPPVGDLVANQIMIQLLNIQEVEMKAFVVDNPLNKVYEVFDQNGNPARHRIRLPEEYLTIRVNDHSEIDQVWITFSEAEGQIIKIRLKRN